MKIEETITVATERELAFVRVEIHVDDRDGSAESAEAGADVIEMITEKIRELNDVEDVDAL